MAGFSHNGCLGLVLQVLDKLPTIPINLSYCMLIPMMLAYGPESYAYQTWHKDGEETFSLREEVRASHLFMRKLKQWGSVGTFQSSLHPTSLPPMITCTALQRKSGSPPPNLTSVHSQDAVTAVCLPWEPHANASPCQDQDEC